jgi:cation diffusion facilitator family transporter
VRASRSGRTTRSLAVALAANVVVAAAKLGAGLVTGSSGLLAEAAHSVADSTNELMLAFSLRRAARPADPTHPFGYGGARFLCAFLAAISSFLIGGCVSVGLAIEELVHGGAVDVVLLAWIVLAVAALADGASLVQTIRQARHEAAEWGAASTIRFLRHTSEPTLRALAVEDTAALVGVALAAAGLLVRELGGPASSDAIASLLIGILLGATAIGLARPLTDLLIGRSMRPQRLERARDARRLARYGRGPRGVRCPRRAAGGHPRGEGAPGGERDRCAARLRARRDRRADARRPPRDRGGLHRRDRAARTRALKRAGPSSGFQEPVAAGFLSRWSFALRSSIFESTAARFFS